MKAFKIFIYTTVCILCSTIFYPAVVEAAESESDLYFDHKKEKKIERSFKVDNSHSLKISNRYGRVRLINWDKPEFKVTIRITAEESSERRVQDALDRVQIIESNQGKVISFETEIESAPRNWWPSLTGSGNSSLSIDYLIYLPKSNAIQIENRYGDTEIGDRNGSTSISIGYGTLTAGKLFGKTNSIKSSYSTTSIDAVSQADISANYSKFKLNSADVLKLSLRYTSGSRVERVNDHLEASLSYSGSFEVGLGKNVKSTSIKSSYSGVEIRTEPGSKFSFDVSSRYGKFNYDKNSVSMISENKGNTSSTYKGNWNGKSANRMEISASYGNITLKIR